LKDRSFAKVEKMAESADLLRAVFNERFDLENAPTDPVLVEAMIAS
jgi:hypothetical protein